MTTFRLTKNTFLKDYLLLLIFTLIVFWPLSLNFLSLKNDALVQYLAYRYHLSEAIQNGLFPFWSPYLYTGFPVHADMQGETWNPIVLLLSLISRYNMVVLQWEVLIYLFISSIAMFRLSKHLDFSRNTCMCLAVSYMCCGYMMDSISVIPWIASAAFIPFVLLYFLRLLKTVSTSNILKLSLSLCLLFLCGYPSFFIIINYILAISFIIWAIGQIRMKNQRQVIKFFVHIVCAYIIFLLICSPAIISYYEFLPYYARGSGLSLTRAATNPFVPFSLISYILSSVPAKADFISTDPTMRNAYVGIFLFIFFLISLFNLDNFKKVVLGFIIFFFLFSLGDLVPVHKFCYEFLPLMDTFRHPGTIRVFTSIGIIILAGYGIDSFFKTGNKKQLLMFTYSLLIIITGFLIYFLLTDKSVEYTGSISWDPGSIKQYLYGISFNKFAAYLATIQLFFVIAFLFVQYQKVSHKKTVGLFILNSFVFAWICLPFTVVSQYQTKAVDQFLSSFPDGYPIEPLNAPVESELIGDSAVKSVHGYPKFYNKKITIQDHVITPTLNSDYGKYLKNSQLRSSLKSKPFAYISDSNRIDKSSSIHLKKFTPNNFNFEINCSAKSQFAIFQQYNHNWKAKINNQPVVVNKANIAFMSIDVPAGRSIVEWTYKPVTVYITMVISALTLIAVLLYFVLHRKSKVVQ